MSATRLREVYYDIGLRKFYIQELGGREWIEIPSPVNEQVTKKPRTFLDLSIRTESVTYEDYIICIEAVRASNDKEFYHLEILDKRNGGFHTNKPEFWDNLLYDGA